jgi:hypothetical protein
MDARNPFVFNRFRTLSIAMGVYTPLALFFPTVCSPIACISRRPSHFSSTAYKMLLPQLLCFDNDPFSWGVGGEGVHILTNECGATNEDQAPGPKR